MNNWWRGGHKKPQKLDEAQNATYEQITRKMVGEPVSTGFVDNFVDDILKRYGITEKTVKGITEIVDSVVKNVSVKEIGDETFITIHIKDIHFKFKK